MSAEDETAVLDLLTTERDAAVAEGTRLRNQLHALLLHLDPEYRAHLPALDTKYRSPEVMHRLGGMSEARRLAARAASTLARILSKECRVQRNG